MLKPKVHIKLLFIKFSGQILFLKMFLTIILCECFKFFFVNEIFKTQNLFGGMFFIKNYYKLGFFWSDLYKIEVMITSFIEMLELTIFGHMTLSTM